MSLSDIKSDGLNLILNASKRSLKGEIMYKEKKLCDILSIVEARDYPEPLVFSNDPESCIVHIIL